VIAQFIDVINKDDPPPRIGTIRPQSTARFLNDRTLRIPPYQLQPTLGGPLTGRREVYVLYLKISPATDFGTLRLRALNGSILSASPRVRVENRDEVSVDVRSTAGKAVAVNFDCNPIFGSWVLQFGTEAGWDYCPLVAEFLALIRASAPKDENSIELPRFVTGFRSRMEPLGEDLRGSVGQPYGRTVRQLRTYAVEFRRVPARAIEDYYERVSVTVPHFIVPYPENVEHAPPIWCTLAEPPEFAKRDENGWLWNCRLGWREAY